jgi:hypothetical protein
MSASHRIDVERLGPDYQGSTYANPVVWDNAIGYMSNSWCWNCGTWTKHSYNDHHKSGVSERCCNNCGWHYAVALFVVPAHRAQWHKELIAETHRQLQDI